MTSHEEPLYQECPTRSTSAQPDPRLVTSLECISNYTRSDKTHLYYRVGKLHNVLFVFKTSYLYFNCKQQQSILLAVLDFFLLLLLYMITVSPVLLIFVTFDKILPFCALNVIYLAVARCYASCDICFNRLYLECSVLKPC